MPAPQLVGYAQERKYYMESPTQSRSPLQYVILCLCILNLLVTGYLFSKVTSMSSGAATEQAALPEGLSAGADRMILFEKIKSLYNAKDFDGLFSLFDESIRVQLQKEKTNKLFENIYASTGQIKNGAFGMYEVQSGQGGVRNYTLTYPINTENGNAAMLIFVFQQGNEPYRLAGIRINKAN